MTQFLHRTPHPALLCTFNHLRDLKRLMWQTCCVSDCWSEGILVYLWELYGTFPQIVWICIWLNPWIRSPGCRRLSTSWVRLVTRTTEMHRAWPFSCRSCQHVCASPVSHGGMCGTIQSKYKVLCCSGESLVIVGVEVGEAGFAADGVALLVSILLSHHIPKAKFIKPSRLTSLSSNQLSLLKEVFLEELVFAS